MRHRNSSCRSWRTVLQLFASSHTLPASPLITLPPAVSEVLAMTNQSLTAKRIFLNACLLLTISLSLSAIVFAQQTNYDAERQRALDLYDQNKFVEVIPILEKLTKIKSDDSVV